MIRRLGKNLTVFKGDAPEASAQLERDGCTVLRGVFTEAEVAELRTEIDAVFESVPPERVRDDKDEFRYEMLNRSAACQRAIAHPRILEVIEPLLGDDCHVIANTAWRNPPEFPGGFWHSDAGPHVPAARGRALGRPHPVPRVRDRRAHPAAGLHASPTGRPRSCPGVTARAGSRRSIA